MLVENHSLKPYRQRVLGTYVLLEASLKTLAERRRGAEGRDRQGPRAARPQTVDANWKAKAEPVGTIDFLTIASEEVALARFGRRRSRASSASRARP